MACVYRSSLVPYVQVEVRSAQRRGCENQCEVQLRSRDVVEMWKLSFSSEYTYS